MEPETLEILAQAGTIVGIFGLTGLSFGAGVIVGGEVNSRIPEIIKYGIAYEDGLIDEKPNLLNIRRLKSQYNL